MKKEEILEKIHYGLIVSCQALEDEPLHSSKIMSKMALAAKQGGAVGIRANSVMDIIEIKKNVNLPLIGIIKKDYDKSDVYITPTLKEVEALINSPADIIAFDATKQIRPDNLDPREIINMIKDAEKIPMADISTYEEGIRAAKDGAEIISTTLAGYTTYSKKKDTADFELISKLSKRLNIPVIAEGRVNTSKDVLKCLECGAYCVVVGSMITRPQIITERFVQGTLIYKKRLEENAN